ncbi:MAG: pyridoxamine 5'-phosphate oxidase family protein [Planctomycetes bacterium]|nr:pyridoxamine 5'-phosphate oxidase family protein [Planctomycetota bacterium]
MAENFLRIAFTPSVLDAQRRAYGRAQGPLPGESRGAVDAIGPDERAFIEARDSFYMATVSETGWPYVQHRGGPAGFLRVLDARTIAFADVRGNRQLVSAGNLAHDARVALILVDYPRRARLKVLGRASVLDPKEHPELAAQLLPAGKVERIVRIDVVGLDWNCPQNLTPRYTEAEVEEYASVLRARIAELEAELATRADGRT